MGTRSTIAIKLPNGDIKAIFVGHDGMPESLGVMLSNNYSDPEKVARLIEGGHTDGVHEHVETCPYFKNCPNIDPGYPTKPEVYPSEKRWMTHMEERFCQHAYMFDERANSEEKWIRFDIFTMKRRDNLIMRDYEEPSNPGWGS